MTILNYREINGKVELTIGGFSNHQLKKIKMVCYENTPLEINIEKKGDAVIITASPEHLKDTVTEFKKSLAQHVLNYELRIGGDYAAYLDLKKEIHDLF